MGLERLLGSTALSGMIRDGNTLQVLSLMQAGRAVGMQTMNMALEQLVAKGAVALDDAVARAFDTDVFQEIVDAALTSALSRPPLPRVIGPPNGLEAP